MSACLMIFYTFFKIGLFSFGGGYAMLPLISQEVVTKHQWMNIKEFTDLVAISQATPGPIAINGATYIGFKVAGFWGSVFGTLGVILPSIIIMLIITKFFFKFKNNKYVEDAFLGLRPATVGLVAAAAVLVGGESFIDFKSVIIFIAVFIASFKFEADPILLTVLSGIVGLILYK